MSENLTTNPVCNEKLADVRTRLSVFNHFYAMNGGVRSKELEDLEYVLECLATAERQLSSLTAEVAELRLSADANLYVAQQHMLRESVMASEVAELRRDAERYRWLRDHWWLDDKADATPAPMMNAQSPEQFDAAIDAALGDSRDA